MGNKKVQRITRLSMLLAVGIILHFAEGMIELPAIPGVRLGFANIVGLIVLYIFGGKEMVMINLFRVFFASLLNGRLFSIGFWLSLTGVMLSTFMCLLFKKFTKMSIFGISVVSATFHGIGQILAVMFLYKQFAMVYYLPILTLAAIPTGLFTALIAYQVLKRVKGANYGESY